MKYLQLICLLFSINLAWFNVSNATSVLGINLEQALAGSEFVFEGQVVKINVKKDTLSGLIKTFVTFKVINVIKGNPDTATQSLSFLGGHNGNEMLEIEDMHIPKLGEKGIYFVESLMREQVHPLIGWSQGHFLIIPDQNGTDRITTMDKKPVMNISVSKNNTTELSQGYTQGLELANPSLLKSALSKRDFKHYLKSLSSK